MHSQILICTRNPHPRLISHRQSKVLLDQNVIRCLQPCDLVSCKSRCTDGGCWSNDVMPQLLWLWGARSTFPSQLFEPSLQQTIAASGLYLHPVALSRPAGHKLCANLWSAALRHRPITTVEPKLTFTGGNFGGNSKNRIAINSFTKPFMRHDSTPISHQYTAKNSVAF